MTAPQDDNQRHRRPPKAPGKKKTADEEPGSSDKAGPTVRVSRRVGQTEGGGTKGDNKGVVLRLSTLVILQSDSKLKMTSLFL